MTCICPRCAYGTVTTVATSPVPGVWNVLQCDRCRYMWRTTEPDRRTRRDLYPAEFRLTQADLDDAPEVPSVPPRFPGPATGRATGTIRSAAS
ncbi:non-oxidative hydroxyarylic acid decarboxylases subunit D [Streptomyces tibetensis]|uniref:non-oxidative hydroxyarylic acid decarboxylases subunit D n=1 Tax=Streptomyces tibetensis TaxID=2382123 RepID=UPI0033C4330F